MPELNAQSRTAAKQKKKMDITKTTIMLCLAAATLAMSCGRRTSKNAARQGQLRKIDDSIQALSPNALAMARKELAKQKDSMGYYEHLVRIGRYFYLSETPDSAMKYANRTIQFAMRQQPSKRRNTLLADAYSCKANVLFSFHKHTDKVIQLNTMAYKMLMDGDNSGRIPKICANLGDAYMIANDLPSAALWYRRALYVADSLRLPAKDNVTLYMGLGRIYVGMQDYEAALECYQNTQRFANTMSPSMKAYFLTSYGNLFYFKKDYKRSLEKFLQQKRLLEKHGMQNKFDMYVCKINLADIYLNIDSLDLAKAYLAQCDSFFKKHEDRVANYYCNTIRIGIAVKERKPRLAMKIMASEHGGVKPEESLIDIRNRYAIDVYKMEGDYRKAFDVLSNSVKRADSLEHNRQAMRSAEIMARFSQDTLILHHKIEMEQKNTAIQKAKLEMTAAVASLAILSLLLAVWIMNSRKQKLQTQMRMMNLKLSIARNRISPHFVFNVLNNKITKAGGKEAGELMELTRLIRLNLDMSCQTAITLDKELGFVSRYVSVESYLMGSDFDFEIKRPEHFDLSKVAIPSMFLQILVENAIVHGLKGWDGHKRLKIEITRQEGCTIVAVEDNGPGFNATNGSLKKKTGLGIISQTIAIMNQRSKRKMHFDLKNIEGPGGETIGCRASLTLPDNMEIINQAYITT